MDRAEGLREKMDRRDSILNIQEEIRGVLHGKNHEEHYKRTRGKGVHLQHAHKPINRRTGKESGKDAKHQNQDSRKKRQKQKPN